MPTKTTNYNLMKPQDTDNADLKVFIGDNMDIIDTEIGKKLDKLDLTSHTGNSVIHITSSERNTWNSKASNSLVTTSANGLMIATDKTKLDGISSGANNYIHPSTHPSSIIVQDANNRFVTDLEKSNWNSKATTSIATATSNGLMIATDKTKLDGIETNANNYSHPSTHPASIIVQDTNNRFVTDAERTKLAGVSTGANNYVHPSSHPASIITQDSNNRFVTDADKSNWDGKATTSIVTSTSNGLMIGTDKAKLDGIELGSNKYVHPTTHPASIIVQDSSNRFMTDAERTKLNGISTGANSYVHPASHPATIIVQDVSNRFVTDAEKNAWNGKADANSVYTKAETDTRIQGVVGSAPEALDTLKELAQALGDDANFSATVTTNLSNKVDKVVGKQLSTEDYTTSDKTKLSGITAGANNYVHPSTHPASIIVQDVSNRFVTDVEKNAWNGKASTSVVTTTANGLMEFADKVKLNGITAGANNYVHPVNHPASIITQDANNRFMTDTERTKLSGISASANKILNHANNGSISVDGTEQVVYIHPSTHPATMITEDATHRFMTDTERTKLTGVTAGANKILNHANNGSISVDSVEQVVYTHPSNHPASVITQDSSNRFVTDSEKNTWNAKETTGGSQSKVDTHAGDSIKHITATERATWNKALQESGGTMTGDLNMASKQATFGGKFAIVHNSTEDSLDFTYN